MAAGEQNIHHSQNHSNAPATMQRGQAWVREHWIASVLAVLVIAFVLVRIFHHGYAPPEPQNTNGHVSTAFNTETTGPDLADAVSRRVVQVLGDRLPSELARRVRVRVYQLPGANKIG